MANSDITINGIPLHSIGVTLLTGAYSSLLTPPPLKDFVKNNDPTKPGTDVIVDNPVVSERDVTLTFLIEGKSKGAFLSNYKAFVAQLHKGKIELYIPELDQYFHLLYSNSTQFANYRLNACKIAVKFNEPNPTYRIPEGAGPLVTSDDLVLVTSNGDIFYVAEQYKIKYTGSDMDDILTDVKNLLPLKKDKTIYEAVEGQIAVIDVKGGYDYTCGTLTSLTIKSVENSPKESSIRFTSGNTATELILPQNLNRIGYWTPAPNMTYEINIENNIAVIMEFNSQTNSETMTAQSTNSSIASIAANTFAATTADGDTPVGQYNSIHTGVEIDEILTEAHEEIPQKEDKPIVESISGTEVTINVEGNHKYICGELVSLKIGTVEKSARTSAIFFSSGATATELTWNDIESVIGYKIPEPNRAYEINIKNGAAVIVCAE